MADKIPENSHEFLLPKKNREEREIIINKHRFMDQ
jgi:hypothetical protein